MKRQTVCHLWSPHQNRQRVVKVLLQLKSCISMSHTVKRSDGPDAGTVLTSIGIGRS